MARQVRVEYEGAMYHVMARGDRREAIVSDDEDRKTFIRTLGEAAKKTGMRIHAYAGKWGQPFNIDIFFLGGRQEE